MALKSRCRTTSGTRAGTQTPHHPCVSSAGRPASSVPGISGITGERLRVVKLTRAGQAIISVHFVPFEIYLLLALYYYVLIKALSYLSRWIESRMPVL